MRSRVTRSRGRGTYLSVSIGALASDVNISPVPVAEAEAPVAEGTPDVAVKKYELMQLDWHEAYACVSSRVPLPWGQSAAHWVVALTWAASGQGTLTHAAWQQMSEAAPIRIGSVVIRTITLR